MRRKKPGVEVRAIEQEFQRAVVNHLAPLLVPRGFAFNCWAHGDRTVGVLFEAAARGLAYPSGRALPDSGCADLWIHIAAETLVIEQCSIEVLDVPTWLREEGPEGVADRLEVGDLTDRIAALAEGLDVLTERMVAST